MTSWLVGISALVILSALLLWVGFFVGCSMAVQYYEDEKADIERQDPETRLRAAAFDLTRQMSLERCQAFAADCNALWPATAAQETDAANTELLHQSTAWQALQKFRGN